jgi:hypothetical protein
VLDKDTVVVFTQGELYANRVIKMAKGGEPIREIQISPHSFLHPSPGKQVLAIRDWERNVERIGILHLEGKDVVKRLIPKTRNRQWIFRSCYDETTLRLSQMDKPGLWEWTGKGAPRKVKEKKAPSAMTWSFYESSYIAPGLLKDIDALVNKLVSNVEHREGLCWRIARFLPSRSEGTKTGESIYPVDVIVGKDMTWMLYYDPNSGKNEAAISICRIDRHEKVTELGKVTAPPGTSFALLRLLPEGRGVLALLHDDSQVRPDPVMPSPDMRIFQYKFKDGRWRDTGIMAQDFEVWIP